MTERYHSIVYPLVGTHHFMRYPTLLVFEIFSAVLHPEHLRREPKNRKTLPWAQKIYITIKVGRRNPPRDPLHVVSSAPRRPPWEVPNLRLSPARWTSTHLWKGGLGNLNLGVYSHLEIWQMSGRKAPSRGCQIFVIRAFGHRLVIVFPGQVWKTNRSHCPGELFKINLLFQF